MPSVNAAAAVPVATALAQVPATVNQSEIKTGIVVETIPIAGTANLVGVQNVPAQNASPVKAVASSPSTSDHHEVRNSVFKNCFTVALDGL